jgi:hypothetical protein
MPNKFTITLKSAKGSWHWKTAGEEMHTGWGSGGYMGMGL